MSIPNQLEGTSVGSRVSLVCHIEAYPLPIVYWTTDTGDVIIDSEMPYLSQRGVILTLCLSDLRFIMTVTHQNEYKMTMTLNISRVSAGDFRGYRCVIRNSLGETDGLIRLFGKLRTKKLLLLFLR